MRVARRFVVRGRVQGVGFRHHVAAAARAHGVDGWVCNRPDGSVEAFIEAEADAAERFERIVRQGPASARVDSVDVTGEPASGRTAGFRITG
jgi:acylphosphatase